MTVPRQEFDAFFKLSCVEGASNKKGLVASIAKICVVIYSKVCDMRVTLDVEEINMAYDEQEKNLMAALQELTVRFSNYDPPRLRKDGDIVIPLDAVLKKNREVERNFAEAFSQLMRDDLGPKRSSTWIK